MDKSKDFCLDLPLCCALALFLLAQPFFSNNASSRVLGTIPPNPQGQLSEIDFADHQYAPRSGTVRDAGTVQICNHDVIYQSPFSLSTHNKFTGPQLARGQFMSLTPHNPAYVPIPVGLYCEIHPQEKMMLTVLPRANNPGANKDSGLDPNTGSQDGAKIHYVIVKVTGTDYNGQPRNSEQESEGDLPATGGTIPISYAQTWATGFANMTGSITVSFPRGVPKIQASARWNNSGLGFGRPTGIFIADASDNKGSFANGETSASLDWEGPASGGLTIYVRGPQNRIVTLTIPSSPPPPPQRLNDEQIRPVATLTAINGDVGVRHGEGNWEDAQVGMVLGPMDEVHTGPDSAATVEGYKDGWSLDVLELSQVRIGSLESRESRLKVRVLLQMGYVRSKVVRQRTLLTDFSIQTPTATASVRGTVFGVKYDKPSRTTTVLVEQGSVSVQPENSSLAPVVLAANQRVQVSPQQMSAITASTPADFAGTSQENALARKPAGDVPWPTEKYDHTLLGTNLSYFPINSINSIAECRAKCADNQQCKGFAVVKPGAFASNPNNAVCYLLSSVTKQVPSACCVSGFRR